MSNSAGPAATSPQSMRVRHPGRSGSRAMFTVARSPCSRVDGSATAGRGQGRGVLGQGEHPLPHFTRRDLGPVLPPSQGVVDDRAARVGPDPLRLEQAEERVERCQSVRRGAEERHVEVSDRSEHGPGLVAADDGLPGEDRVTEVPHHQHAAAVVAVPRVDDRMEHRRGQGVEHATPDEVHLPPRRVAGEAHDQIDRRVETLHHDPGAVGEDDALQHRTGTPVVVDRRTVHNAFEERTVHDPMVLARSMFAQTSILTPWRSAPPRASRLARAVSRPRGDGRSTARSWPGSGPVQR